MARREVSEKKIEVPDFQTASINDEMIQKARELIGVWLRRDVHWPAQYEPFSLHDIRRWAIYSVGDDNPLWSEPEYAKRTRYGSNIAPPTFLYTVDTTIVAPGFPGVQWIYAGSDWRLYRPVRVGDCVTAKARVIDVQEKSGRRVKRFVMQKGEVLYYNQRDELIAKCISEIIRMPRARSEGGRKDPEERTESPVYSKDDRDKIAGAYESERRQGSEPRYWEDVKENEELDAIIKGPLTLVDIVAFYAGRRYVYNPLKFAFGERKRHPANVYVSPRTGIPVHPAAGHFDPEIAKEVGFPRAYDQGFMRINWLGHLVTNWMGDDAWIRRLKGEHRFPCYVGDLCWCKGIIRRKFVEDRNYLVELEIWVERQDGVKITEGLAVVKLPSRDIHSYSWQ
jgi:acyl dehydratase